MAKLSSVCGVSSSSMYSKINLEKNILIKFKVGKGQPREIQIDFLNGTSILLKASSDGYTTILTPVVGTTLKVRHADFAVGIQVVERE